MPKRETIGKRLHRLRTAHGLSQRGLSSPGVSYASISRVEADARTPSVKAIRKLADKLGVSPTYLETGAESPIEQGVADAGADYGSLRPPSAARSKTPPTRPRPRALARPPSGCTNSAARTRRRAYDNG